VWLSWRKALSFWYKSLCSPSRRTSTDLFALQASKAPGQNLDRRISPPLIHSTNTPLISWTHTAQDSGNTSLNKGSYGPPYTLTLNISAPFSLSGPDTTLSLTNISSNLSLVFTTADNFRYPLRAVSILDGHDHGHPGRIWTNQSSSTHTPVSITLPATLRLETDVVNGTRVWVNESFAGRFEVFVYGGRNTLFSWSQMALVAPLDRVEGGVSGVKLEAGVGRWGVWGGTALPQGSGSRRREGASRCVLGMILGIVVMCGWL
jgi:hexosaminidase